MDAMLKPTSIRLVGIAFLFIYIYLLPQAGLGVEWPASPSYPDSIKEMEEYHSDFINNQDKPTTEGQLSLPGDTVYFPWASQQVLGLRLSSPDIAPRSKPVKESILLEGSHPLEHVNDLKVMNAIKQRDIIYGETQINGSKINGSNSESLVNSMSVKVVGAPSKEVRITDNFENIDPEKLVDNALNSGMNNRGRKSNPGNYLNIDVSGITVSAINTIEGGSAVATSNIIIKPVQIIYSSSQASDKI